MVGMSELILTPDSDTPAQKLARYEYAYESLKSIKEITESIKDALDVNDYELCVVKFLQRQDYIRNMVLMGEGFPDRNHARTLSEADIEKAISDVTLCIQEVLDEITELDSAYEKILYEDRETIGQSLRDLGNARRFVRDTKIWQSPSSRFVDLIES